MKNTILIILLAIVAISCGEKSDGGNDVASLKQQLADKKSEIEALENDVLEINAKIEKLEPRKEKAIVLITTDTISKVDFKRYTDVQASVMSDDEVLVSSETGGRLLSVHVKEGEYVKRGQAIARVDLQSLTDQKAEIETSMSLAKDVYDRQKRLWDQNIGSEIQYLQAKNGYERLQKTLATLNTQIGKSTIYSPISGVVDREFLKAGELAAPGAPIVQLFNPNKLKITADIPETYLGKIDRKDEVRISFPAIDEEVTKRISLLGRTIDPSNRTFKVEVTTNSMNGKLKPNLLAELSFNDYAKEDAIVVPLEIVQQEVSGKKYVYVSRKSDGKFLAKKTFVTTGESYDGDVIIETGLTDGDQIIIEGARSVADGDPVKIINQ